MMTAFSLSKRTSLQISRVRGPSRLSLGGSKGPGIIGGTAWPRVVYLGPPKDLAKRETQHSFHWFQGQDGMVTCPDCNGWYQHTYKLSFPEGIDELQVRVGWKINWETLRTVQMDNVLLQAGLKSVRGHIPKEILIGNDSTQQPSNLPSPDKTHLVRSGLCGLKADAAAPQNLTRPLTLAC